MIRENKDNKNKQKQKQKPIIILGGGPAGLAAAYELAKKGRKIVVMEKENQVGGLSATLKKDGFLYEFGPHAFHLKDPKITLWLQKSLGQDFRVIPTKTQVLIRGKLLNYPLSGGELFSKIPPFLALKILGEYFLAYIKRFLIQRKPQSFEEWGLQNFGPTLYKMSFGDYTQKVWGLEPRKLSARLATQKLSRLNLGDIILKLLGFRGKFQPAYFKKYLYPRTGAGLIFQKMIEEIVPAGQILLEAEATKVKSHKGRIYAVEYKERGLKKTLLCQGVISTLTLQTLIPMMNALPKPKVLAAAGKLNYRDLIIVYLVLENHILSQAQWIYLVENKFRFNRITFGKNLSPSFAPTNKNVLALEVGAQKDDELWQKSDEELLAMAKKDLALLGWENLKIDDFWVKRIVNVYPIFLEGFENYLTEALKGLHGYPNLISTGRNGLFLNSDIHDSFLLGFQAGREAAQWSKR